MAIAALYDIHGNLPALNAVLAEIDTLGAEQIVIGGDVAYGPLVAETLDRLIALGERCIWLRGNADREIVAFFDARTASAPLIDPDILPELQLAGDWEAARITRALRNFLDALPETTILSDASLGEILFCHGSPRSDEETITTATPDERMRNILAGVRQSIVVCGHTHTQFDRRVSCGIRLVNAGSVGNPYEAEIGAFWVLLGTEAGVEFRRTPYDADKAASQFRASGHPLAEQFASYLTHPTPPESSAVFFETLALHRSKTQSA